MKIDDSTKDNCYNQTQLPIIIRGILDDGREEPEDFKIGNEESPGRRRVLMKDKRGHLVDRRAEKDRRKAYNLNYLSSGGVERRNTKERRSEDERRTGWLRIDNWYSICMRAITRAKKYLP